MQALSITYVYCFDTGAVPITSSLFIKGACIKNAHSFTPPNQNKCTNGTRESLDSAPFVQRS